MKTFVLGVLALALAAPAPAGALDDAALAEAKRALQQAVDRTDVAGILEARARFQSLAALEPKAPLPHYWTAVADWRVVPLLLNAQGKAKRKEAERHCEAGIAAAERALELEPRSAEALALKAGLQGLSTTFKSMAAMMSLGPAMEGDLGRATGLAPDNPRVHLFDAMNTLHKPGFVGGGPKQAMPKFQRAIEAFGQQTAAGDAAAIDWGRDDALLWAGRAAMKLKDYSAAHAYFTRALEANPDNGWVRSVLLPEAERAAAKGSGGKEKS